MVKMTLGKRGKLAAISKRMASSKRVVGVDGEPMGTSKLGRGQAGSQCYDGTAASRLGDQSTNWETKKVRRKTEQRSQE